MDDLTLLTMLARDLDAAFEAFALAYQRRLYGLALRLTNNPPDAEEIAQDALVRAYRALATYPAERIQALALRAWLYQIAVNVWRNRVRRAQLRIVPLDGDDGAPAYQLPGATEAQPERQAEAHERSRELGALIAGLAPRYRAPVVLRHVYELSYQEIAATLEQPVGTVKANVHRGVRLLRAALEAQPEGDGGAWRAVPVSSDIDTSRDSDHEGAGYSHQTIRGEAMRGQTPQRLALAPCGDR